MTDDPFLRSASLPSTMAEFELSPLEDTEELARRDLNEIKKHLGKAWAMMEDFYVRKRWKILKNKKGERYTSAQAFFSEEFGIGAKEALENIRAEALRSKLLSGNKSISLQNGGNSLEASTKPSTISNREIEKLPVSTLVELTKLESQAEQIQALALAKEIHAEKPALTGKAALYDKPRTADVKEAIERLRTYEDSSTETTRTVPEPKPSRSSFRSNYIPTVAERPAEQPMEESTVFLLSFVSAQIEQGLLLVRGYDGRSDKDFCIPVRLELLPPLPPTRK